MEANAAFDDAAIVDVKDGDDPAAKVNSSESPSELPEPVAQLADQVCDVSSFVRHAKNPYCELMVT